jgi:hypothetical protein
MSKDIATGNEQIAVMSGYIESVQMNRDVRRNSELLYLVIKIEALCSNMKYEN